MTYYYLSEKPEIPYTVDAKPPPADEAEARLCVGSPEGRVLETWNLAKQGKGTLALSFAKATLEDSPLAIVVAFRKGEGPKALHETSKPLLLADPQPAKIKAPSTVKVGDEVDLTVAAWVAVTHAGPGKTADAPERDTARIPKAAKDEVRWRVDGEDLTVAGESVKLKIEPKHCGKPIVVEAYRGTPSGRAKAELKGPKLASVEPAPAKAAIKVFVNLAADEAKRQGRKVTITAKVAPPQAGVPVFFTLDKDLGRRIDKEHLDLPAALSASVSPAKASTNAEGVATTTLTLSTCGGDRYRVSAALRKDVKVESEESLESGWLEVWRRVALEVDRMKRRAGAGRLGEEWDREGMAKDLAEQFLELETTGADSAPAFRWILTQSTIAAWARSIRDGTGDVPAFQLAFVNAIGAKPSVTTVTYDVTAPRWFDKANAINNCFDPTDFVTAATWSQGERRGDLDRSLVTIEYLERFNAYELRIDLSRHVVAPTPEKPVRVRLDLKRYVELAGAQLGGATLIGVRQTEQLLNLPRDSAPQVQALALKKSDLKTFYRHVVLHEAGHALGLAAKTTPEQPARAEPAYYDEHPKHIGPHCKNDAECCLMWGKSPDGSPTPRLRFCDRCQAALRARPLGSLPANAKAPF